MRNYCEENDGFHYAFSANSVLVIDIFNNLNFTSKRETILIVKDIEPQIIGLFNDLLYKGSCFGNQNDIKYLRELILAFNLRWGLS